jgi:hypothetical protein
LELLILKAQKPIANKLKDFKVPYTKTSERERGGTKGEKETERDKEGR